MSTEKTTLSKSDTITRFFINDIVITPDGKGIVKRIEELYSGNIGYTCVLENPYIITDSFRGIREYGFPKYSFGYMYSEGLIKVSEN